MGYSTPMEIASAVITRQNGTVIKLNNVISKVTATEMKRGEAFVDPRYAEWSQRMLAPGCYVHTKSRYKVAIEFECEDGDAALLQLIQPSPCVAQPVY